MGRGERRGRGLGQRVWLELSCAFSLGSHGWRLLLLLLLLLRSRNTLLGNDTYTGKARVESLAPVDPQQHFSSSRVVTKGLSSVGCLNEFYLGSKESVLG